MSDLQLPVGCPTELLSARRKIERLRAERETLWAALKTLQSLADERASTIAEMMDANRNMASERDEARTKLSALAVEQSQQTYRSANVGPQPGEPQEGEC